MKHQELAIEIAKALDAKQAENIRVLDVRGISTLTDYCVIATGTSGPHLKALISGTQQRMKELNVSVYRKSGDPESGWAIADYVHVVTHVFSPEAREYYSIEMLWTAAPEIPFR